MKLFGKKIKKEKDQEQGSQEEMNQEIAMRALGILNFRNCQK